MSQHPTVVLAAVRELQKLQRLASALAYGSPERVAMERRVDLQRARVIALSDENDAPAS